MKNVKLLELTLDARGGEEPAAGSEITIGGISYRVIEVHAPKTKSSKWRQRSPSPETQKWRLLVEEIKAED